MKCIVWNFILGAVFFTASAQSTSNLLEQAKRSFVEEDYATAANISNNALSQSKVKSSVEYRALVDIFIESSLALNEVDASYKAAQNYISVLQNLYGEDDTTQVSYIAVLGQVNYIKGYYDKAIDEFTKALAILEAKKLKHERTYAEIENNIGMLYSQLGETAKAISSLEVCRMYFEKESSKNTIELAQVYNNLGDAFHNKYNYQKADYYYKASLAEFVTLEDQSSADYLNTFGNYALLLLDKGEHDLAITNLLKNKTIAEKSMGKESHEYAAVLNNLGQAYKKTGNYRLAEDYLIQSYEVKKTIYSAEHPSMMTTMNNLAMFYYAIGQFDKAELILNELLMLNKKHHAEDLQQVLLYSNNLSAVYFSQNKISKAEKIAQDVVSVSKKTKGESSVEYFQALNGYSAILLESENNLEQAYQNYIKLTSLYSKLKSQLPVEDVISYYNNKGTSEMYTNRHSEAVADFQTGMKVVDDYYGTQHSDYYLFKSNLAYDLTLQGKTLEAASPLLESAKYKLASVVELFPTLTESEKEFYAQTSNVSLSHYYVFGIKNNQRIPTLPSEMINLRLQSKALVMRSMNDTKSKILSSNNLILISEFNNVLLRKKELAKLHKLSKGDLRRLGVNVETETLEVERLEKQMLKNSEYLTGSLEATNWKSVAQKLKQGEAAVEVIRVKDDFYEKTKIIYYAFLIIKNGQDYPELLVLDNGRVMEDKEFAYYRNNIKYKVENVNSYKTYWSQLASKLVGIQKVYFSADGIYHKINLNTLYNVESKKYLLEEINIELRSNLSNSIGTLIKPSTEAILVGHPNYYLDLKEALNNYSKGLSPQARTVSSDYIEWNDLPGTKEEVKGIAGVLKSNGWKYKLYTEENAIENILKEKNTVGILHIATHGFFEENSNDTLSTYSQDYFLDPMLRSGLALSGAGVDLSPHDLNNIDYFEDGILYANEVANLNLTATNCVVLSACETGLGETRNQEGVYGLQRAFLIAGSKSIIMSLWSVDDMATKDLMIEFYTHYAKDKDLDSSFRKAMNTMKAKYKEPYYWGAFVLMTK